MVAAAAAAAVAAGQTPAAGCIPTDYNNHGVAIGPLKAPAGMYYPVKLVITGWSDGSDVSGGLERLQTPECYNLSMITTRPEGASPMKP